jgi:glycosyltransferase involved in cell wall biosynthesis
MPTISVVIPLYNGARYIAAAVESVLAQTLPATQILVVDDGSTDASVAVVAAYAPRVTLLQTPHGGANRARNLGVAAATGHFLAFLDADDLWTPEKLACQVDFWRANPTVEILFGWAQQFVSPELSAQDRTQLKVAEAPMPAQVAGTMLTTQAVWQKVGPFQPELAMGDVLDWVARAQEARLHIVTLDKVFLRRRIHLDNMTRRLQADRRAYARVLKAALDRRRAQVNL